MNVVRVRQDGSVNIPSDVRNRNGIHGGVVLKLKINHLGQLVFTPEDFKCSCCHKQLHVVDRVTGLCVSCQHLVEDEVRKGSDIKTAVSTIRKSK